MLKLFLPDHQPRRCLKVKNPLILIMTLSLSLPFSALAKNTFADIPLHLRSKSIQTVGYSVKPNILFFIDDSGSMNAGLSEDKYFEYGIKKCLEAQPWPRYNECKIWGKQQNSFDFPDFVVKKDSIPIPPISPDDPPEKMIKVEYWRPHDYNRFLVVQLALTNILSRYRHDFNFALQLFNNRDPFLDQFFNLEEYVDYINLHRKIIQVWAKIHWGTPTFSRLNASARNILMNKLQYRCQKSYLIILSDGVASGYHRPVTDSTLYQDEYDYGYDGYFDGNQSRNDTKLFTERTENFTNTLKYYTETLRTKNFGQYIYSKDIVNSDGKSYNKTTKRTDRRLTDNAGQPWDGPDPLANQPGHTAKFTQTATTFTIGFGLITDGDVMGIELLKNAASPKPDYDPVTNPDSRYFYNVSKPEEILKAFEEILTEIKTLSEVETGTTNTISPTMGESSTTDQDLLIKAQVETEHWSSQLCFHSKNETNEEKNDCNIQPSFNNRKLVLNDGKTSYLFANPASNALNNERFNIRNNQNSNNLEWHDGLLNWFSRGKADNKIKQNGFVLDYRQRPFKPGFGNTRNMGDIINNPIETIGQEEFNKQKYLITSANDGMVYVFRAANSDRAPYDLKFNYMPMAIERNSTDGSDLVSHYYKDLTSKDYGKDAQHPHRYLLNGGFTVVETPALLNKPQQIFMVSNMGQAGRGAFAINIGGRSLTTKEPIAADDMNDVNWYKQLFLFQTPSGSENQFGYTIGTPAVAITRVNRDQNAPVNTYKTHLRELAFINNGVNFPDKEISQNESALYIYDVLGIDVGTESYLVTGDSKGKLVKKLTATNGNGGLASPVVYDSNNDGVADLVYAGDYGGNLYRFDIRDPNPDNWTVTRIFRADGPITVAPTLFAPKADSQDPNAAHKVIVVFGTGSDLYQSDLESQTQQAIYGIYDDYEQQGGSALVLKRNLLQQFMDYQNKTGELSDHPFSSTKYQGWYFKLNIDGERVLSSVNQLLSTGMVMTRSYNLKKEKLNQTDENDPCQIQKTSETTTMVSRLTQFDSISGGKLNKNQPHFTLYQHKQSFKSSIAMDGLVGMRINTGNQYNSLNAGKTGMQKNPGEIAPINTCFYKKPHINLTNGENFELVSTPLCPGKFEILGWREIKTDYVN